MTQNKVTLATEFSENNDQQVQSYNINQPIFLNQLPIVQNQQLVYQVEGVQGLNNLNFTTANGNGQQSLLYIVIPTTNENVQVEAMPIEIVKKEKGDTDNATQPIEFVKVDNDAVNEKVNDATRKENKYFLNNATIQVKRIKYNNFAIQILR